jgi:hypothetical protein
MGGPKGEGSALQQPELVVESVRRVTTSGHQTMHEVVFRHLYDGGETGHVSRVAFLNEDAPVPFPRVGEHYVLVIDRDNHSFEFVPKGVVHGL